MSLIGLQAAKEMERPEMQLRKAVLKVVQKNKIITVPWMKTALRGYGYKITATKVTDCLVWLAHEGIVTETNLGDARRLGARTFERVA